MNVKGFVTTSLVAVSELFTVVVHLHGTLHHWIAEKYFSDVLTKLFL